MATIALYSSILVSVVAFAFAVWLYLWVKKQPSSNEKIAVNGSLIRQGARTFLKKEYKVLAKFACVAGACIFILLPSPIWKGDIIQNILMIISYFLGTTFSAIAGKIGMEVATIANVKSAEAAQSGIKRSFMTGFRGGAVMGMAVVGASLLGVVLVYMLTGDPTTVLGFSFGASSLALFAKAGGGIFTKTADISADLVGKLNWASRKTTRATGSHCR
jgi:K(+)-stimulated pyrophosphate-energized sodium pump